MGLPSVRSSSVQNPRGGSYAVIMALSILPLMGLLALAFDLSYLQGVSYEVQNAAETGALAAARELKYSRQNITNARNASGNILRANFIDGRPIDPARMAEYVPCYWDGLSCSPSGGPMNAMRVRINRTRAKGSPISLFFTQAYGLETSEVFGRATAAIRNWDVMFVTDVSRDMVPVMAQVTVGVRSFLSRMRNSPLDAIGMVTVTGVATDASGTPGVKWQQLTPLVTPLDYATVDNRFSSLRICHSTYAPINPNVDMPDCDAPEGNKQDQGNNLGSGIDASVTELVNWGSEDSFKAIIVVTDRWPQHPTVGVVTTLYQNAAVEAANYAWANYVHVYVVFYNSTASMAEASFMRSLARGVGFSQEVSDPGLISTAISSLAMEVPIAQVQ